MKKNQTSPIKNIGKYGRKIHQHYTFFHCLFSPDKTTFLHILQIITYVCLPAIMMGIEEVISIHYSVVMHISRFIVALIEPKLLAFHFNILIIS